MELTSSSTYYVIFAPSREWPNVGEQRHGHTAQRPHVYGLCVGKAQDNLWSSERGQTSMKKISTISKYSVYISNILEWYYSC